MANTPAGIARPLAYRSAREQIAGGAFAGLLAGTLMLVFTLIASGAAGVPLSEPLRLVAATFLGARAVQGNVAAPLLFGLFLHYLVALGYGVLFVGLVQRISTPASIAWGVVYGVAISVVMRFVLLPYINPELARSPRWPFLAAHVIYGAAVGLAPAFARAWDRRRGTPELAGKRWASGRP